VVVEGEGDVEGGVAGVGIDREGVEAADFDRADARGGGGGPGARVDDEVADAAVGIDVAEGGFARGEAEADGDAAIDEGEVADGDGVVGDGGGAGGEVDGAVAADGEGFGELGGAGGDFGAPAVAGEALALEGGVGLLGEDGPEAVVVAVVAVAVIVGVVAVVIVVAEVVDVDKVSGEDGSAARLEKQIHDLLFADAVTAH